MGFEAPGFGCRELSQMRSGENDVTAAGYEVERCD